MLNMKKGLAIVLAAATALTFAPVSTLGLTGVVEAQAANTTTTKDVASGDQTATINLTKGTAYADGTNAFEYTITTAGNLTANGSNPTIAGLNVALTGSGTTYTIKVTGTPTAAASAKNFVFNDDGAGTHKFTLTVNVNDPAVPSGSVNKVNAIKATDGSYDVYVKAGSNYDIVNGDTTVGGYKTSDENYQWTAVTSTGGTTAFTGSTSTSDGIADIANKPGKGLTITAAGQEDSTIAGTTIYLKASKNGGSVAAGDPEIKVNVHVYKNTGSLSLGNGQTSVQKSVASNISSEIGLAESGSTYVLNKGQIVDGQSTNFTFGQAYITGEDTISLTQPNDAAVKAKNASWNVTGSKIGSFNVKFQIGYLYKGSFEYASLDTVVNVKDASDVVKVIDANGNKISYESTASTDVQKAGINLTKGKTFDLGALTAVYNGTVKVSDATFSYESSSAAVTVSDKGVLTAASKVSGAVITVTAKEGSIELTKAHVLVNVNDLASDELTIKDESGKAYTNAPQYVTYSNNGTPVIVNLTDSTVANNALYNYFNNVVKAKDSKIVYATIDLVDNKSVTLTATSANGNSMPSPVIASSQTYASGTTTNADTVVTSGLAGGKITLTAKAAGYAVIKFTSQDSAKALGGTAYVFVRVLQNPEATIYGLEDTYSIATGKYVSYTSSGRLESQYALNLADKFTTNGGTVTYALMSKSDYPNDDPTAVKVAASGVVTAYKANATAHVKITVSDATNTSTTSKIVEIKTVEPKQNTLTVSAVSGSAIDATLTIDKVTNLTVSADYQEKGISVAYDAASDLDKAVLYTTDYNKNVTLYPNKNGFSVLRITAAGDGETIAPAQKQIVVTYKAKIVPSKVTGVKVSNKKGAKVTVKFNKVTTAPTMKYYVQKKIGKKTSGKSIGSTKTTLSVKKGATVKVRVKAYYYDANGVKRQIVAGANRRLFRAEAPVGVCRFLDDRMNSKVMPQIISAWIAALS